MVMMMMMVVVVGMRTGHRLWASLQEWRNPNHGDCGVALCRAGGPATSPRGAGTAPQGAV